MLWATRSKSLEMPALPGYADEFVALWDFNAAALPVTDEQFELFEPLTQEFVRSRARDRPSPGSCRRCRPSPATSILVVCAFAPYDAVLTPTTALTPRPVGWHTDDPKVNFERQCQYTPNTSFVNVVGRLSCRFRCWLSTKASR